MQRYKLFKKKCNFAKNFKQKESDVMKVKSLFIQWFALSLSIPLFAQGYEIKITINSRNDTVMFGHYFAKRDQFYLNNTCVLDKSGRGVFKGENKLPKGLYSIVSNNQRLLDFVIGDEQTFEIIADTTDLVGKTTAKNSRDNEIFFDFQRMNRRTGIQQYELQQRLQNADSITRAAISEEWQALNMKRANDLWDMIEGSKGLYVHKYLNSQFPAFMRMPSANPNPWQEALPDDAETWSKDSLNWYQYRWYRSNFFSDFDIFDSDMLRTPSYEEKLLDYITKVVPQITDSICAEIDKILIKAQEKDDIFRCILVSLFNHYGSMLEVIVDKGIVPENIWVHIVDKWYIPFASWSTEDFLEKRKKDVADRKPNLIGNLAPPIEMLMVLPSEHFKAAAMDTAIKFDVHAGREIQDFRRELKSKYTAIYFWDYNCGHCRTGIQEMYKVWEELKDKGLQVIALQAIGSREAKGKWIDMINEYDMFGWINAWSPYSYKYTEYYNLTSFPVMYLLDEENRIILKKITAEQLKDIIR